METLKVKIIEKYGWYASHFYKNKVVEVLSTAVVKNNIAVYMTIDGKKWIRAEHCKVMPIEKEVSIVCKNCGVETKTTVY